jgi:hypothetical protein
LPPADGSDDVVLHSTALVYVPTSGRRSFLERLANLHNQSLWKHLTFDGDGSWIYEGLLSNSLVMMSDGSYNDKIGRDLCSCAAVIYCRNTRNKARVTWVEKSDVYTADNYRAELLGGIALQLLVKVATDGKYIGSEMKPRFGCDNKGVVHHGNHPRRPMPEKQPQADVLRYYKRLVRDAPFRSRMFHVYGHLRELLEWDEMTLEEQINDECDQLAGEALAACAQTHDFIERVFPDEDLVVSVDGQKISGATTPAITRHWGDQVARQHYNDMGIIPWDLFDLVYWDGVEKLMNKVPEMFSIWVTKQVSGFCGTNHMLNAIYGNVVDVCPNCGQTPEKSSHIPRCRDAGRSLMFRKSVDTLVNWMEQQQSDRELVYLIRSYLLSRGDRPMLSFCRPNSPYAQLASLTDELGYGNFLEGRICTLFLPMRQLDIEKRGLRKHAAHWCNGLILQLLQITHRQWSYRNQSVNYKALDGLTESQQHEIMRHCEDVLWTDPSVLLPEDRGLLEVDFEALGDGPAIARQIWLSEMKAATSAARIAEELPQTVGEPVGYLSVPVDTEGSIRFRRRRRRLSQ